MPTAYKICINNLEVFEYQKPFEETDLLDIKGRIKYGMFWKWGHPIKPKKLNEFVGN